MIDPRSFDVPTPSYETEGDYGWTAIARAIVDIDGKIGMYVAQARKLKEKVSWGKG